MAGSIKLTSDTLWNVLLTILDALNERLVMGELLVPAKAGKVRLVIESDCSVIKVNLALKVRLLPVAGIAFASLFLIVIVSVVPVEAAISIVKSREAVSPIESVTVKVPV